MTPAQSKTSILAVALPLASLTAIGLLATDLYLPAVPSLPRLLGGTIAQSQLTLASFMATLALSQLLWGWASDRYSEKRVLTLGMGLLAAASGLCALAHSMEVLIFGRALQGFAAGASTVAVPALLRRSFDEADTVRAISVVGSAESLAPALGPILGAALISWTNWRASFWAIATATLLLILVISRVVRSVPARPSGSAGPMGHPLALLGQTTFLRASLSYSLMFGALMVFVASAPQIIAGTIGLPVQYFSVFQVCGVAVFITAASQGGGLVERKGMRRVLRMGSALQLTACFIAIALALPARPNFFVLTLGWCLFGVGLGLKGPSTFATSLSAAGPQAGQAAGLLMLLAFGTSSAATAAVAPFLHLGLMPVAAGALVMTLLSVATSPLTKS